MSFRCGLFAGDNFTMAYRWELGDILHGIGRIISSYLEIQREQVQRACWSDREVGRYGKSQPEQFAPASEVGQV